MQRDRALKASGSFRKSRGSDREILEISVRKEKKREERPEIQTGTARRKGQRYCCFLLLGLSVFSSRSLLRVGFHSMTFFASERDNHRWSESRSFLPPPPPAQKRMQWQCMCYTIYAHHLVTYPQGAQARWQVVTPLPRRVHVNIKSIKPTIPTLHVKYQQSVASLSLVFLSPLISNLPPRLRGVWGA